MNKKNHNCDFPVMTTGSINTIPNLSILNFYTLHITKHHIYTLSKHFIFFSFITIIFWVKTIFLHFQKPYWWWCQGDLSVTIGKDDNILALITWQFFLYPFFEPAPTTTFALDILLFCLFFNYFFSCFQKFLDVIRNIWLKVQISSWLLHLFFDFCIIDVKSVTRNL